jgi:hypothetical protein
LEEEELVLYVQIIILMDQIQFFQQLHQQVVVKEVFTEVVEQLVALEVLVVEEVEMEEVQEHLDNQVVRETHLL